MSPYTFIIATNDPAKAILMARQEIKKRSGVMGTSTFRAGGYAGRWRQISAGIEITIEEKPTVFGVGVANTLIESKIRGYFNMTQAS